MSRVTVVIPNLDGSAHLPECLGSLGDQDYDDFTVIVVDNGSSDGSVAWIERFFPEVRVIELGQNRGFAAACNVGISATDSELVILLNNDTRVDPDYISRFVAAVDEVPEAGFAASLMLRHDQPAIIDSAGDHFSIERGQGINIGAGLPADTFPNRAWVMGAKGGSALFRRSMLDEVGLLDEDFFYIFEDVDLCLRATMAGHRCLYVPDAVVHHKGGVSSAMPLEVRAIVLRNKLWVAGKNLPWPLLLEWTLYGLARGARAAIYAMLHRVMRIPPVPADPLGFPSLAKAMLEALRQMPRKRRSARHLRRLSSSEMRSALAQPMRALSS